MLAKKYKLQIQGFLEKRPRVILRTDFFMVRQLANNLNYSRFGVVISKKVSSSAVVRNKIKRIIFNFIGNSKFHLKPGRDILLTVVFQVKKREEVEKEKIEKELNKILNPLLERG